MNTTSETSYKLLSNALRQLITRPQVADALKAKETRSDTIKKLKITDEIATEIFNILNVIDQHRKDKEPEFNQILDFEESDAISTDKEFLLESFTQIGTAYRISIVMSTAIFVIGIAFLVIAAIRSFTDPESVAATSIIGGIGVVQIVALFYRNPLADIARTVSNTQQGKITVMSYLIGVAILNQQIGLGKPSNEHLQNLIHLTEKTVGQLEKYAEGDSPAYARDLEFKRTKQDQTTDENQLNTD